MHRFLLRAYSLIELLIVVAIIGLLVVALTVGLSSQRDKAEDARAKSDLEKLKIIFEDYYNDHNCYPPPEFFDEASDCAGDQLTPYLNSLPCDRQTQLPYLYEVDNPVCPSWYKLYTTLQISSDQDALRLLGPGGSNLGNYGVSSSNTRVVITPSSATFWCSGVGNCSNFNPLETQCSPAYIDANCTGSNNCQTTGTCNPL